MQWTAHASKRRARGLPLQLKQQPGTPPWWMIERWISTCESTMRPHLTRGKEYMHLLRYDHLGYQPNRHRRMHANVMKQILVNHVPSIDQTTDVFTKPLPTPRFHYLRNKLKVQDSPLSLRGNVSDIDQSTAVNGE
ncbi:hypothetical protein LWI29_015427 [Acer saccharum]|uniref:Uncharacterized protein n=1 Tax=Acer saccharum TaxID=4024 RepID=A0AA39VML7_ACESA|nr:hypothetical protein LWI29_015427 [Acer saccharum]